MPGPSYRQGWGTSFTYEPLDRYKETEQKNAKALMGTALDNAIQKATASVAGRALTPIPMSPNRPQGNSPWARAKRGVDRITPDILEDPAKKVGNTTLDVLGAAQKYVGAPVAGIATGRLGAPQQVGPNGEVFREGSPSWTEFGRGIKKAVTQDPRDTYKESRQAFNEGQADPNLPAWKRIAADVASDPLTYVGPGAVKAATKALPAGVQASKAGRFAGAILENPRGTSLGGLVGASAAGQAAESTGHENLVGPAALIGGFAGGIAGGVRRPTRISSSAPIDRPLTPAVQNAEIDLVAKQARELGDAKTPYRENMVRVGKDRDAIAMGRKALLSRLSSEVSKGEIVPEAADSAKWFIRTVPDKYLEKLGSSYVKGADDATIAGQYVKLNGVDEDDGLLRIVKAVTNRSTEPERVIVHEIGHHLEQFVDDADYMALRSQWEREMGLKGGIFPGSGEGGQKIVDAQPALAQSDAKGFITPTEARDANDAYRYTGGFGEWFAENIADRAVRDFEGAADGMGPWRRAWDSVKEIADATYRWLLRRGEKDAAERVYKNILSGKYEAVGRGGMPETQNLDAAIPGNSAAGSGIPPTGPGNPPPTGGKKPAFDMFDTLAPERRLATEGIATDTMAGIPVGKARQKINTVARNVAAELGGEKLDKNLRQGDDTVFTVKERTRLNNIINSNEGVADDLFARAETALEGVIKKGKDGERRMPNGASFADMFEQKTPAGRAAWNALTPEQRAPLEAMKKFGDDLNSNLRFHNTSGTLGWDDSAEGYFPRVSTGEDGVKRAYLGDGGAKLGTKQRFTHERTYDIFDEGLKNGINYADERQAWKMMARAKLKTAADDYLVKALKPMGKTEKQLGPNPKIGTEWTQVPRDVAPALQNLYFTPEVAERIKDALKKDPSFLVKPLTEANRVLTPLRATGDVSWFAQQGAAMLFRHPVKAAEGAAKVVWSAFGNRQTYDKLIAKQNGNLQEHIRHGLHWTPGDDLADLDYGFVKADTIKGKVASKPGIKQVATGYNKMADFSNQTFSRYMNYARLTFANDAAERLKKMNLSPEEYRKEYQGAMNAVNRMTGRTGRKVTSLESMFAFAPNYFSASVEQVAAAVSRGGLEGSIARAHLLRMLSMGALMALGANAARGYETELDPRDPNFLRIRDVGGLDVSVFGTYDTLFRAMAGTVAGNEDGGPDVARLWKLAEGKMSPGIKLIYEPLRGQTYLGDPIDLSSPEGIADAAKKQGVAALPFSAQNIIDQVVDPAVEEKSLAAGVRGLPSIAASALGASNAPVTPTEQRNFRRDEVAKDLFGVEYDELRGTQKATVNRDERIEKAQAEADKNTLTRADDRSKMQQATIERLERINALSERFDSGELDGSGFREGLDDINNWMQGNRDALGDAGGDDEVGQWLELNKQAKRKDGSTDFELLDELQVGFRAEHPDIDEKMDAITGTRDNETMQQYRVAQGQAKEYYALPQYRGLTPEEGERAGDILKLVGRLVGADQAIGYRQALNWLVNTGEITAEERTLAIRAQKLGKSVERKQFESSHPEFARFYRNSVEEVNGVAAPEAGTYAGVSSSSSRSSSSRRGRRTARSSVDPSNLTRRS